MSPSNHIISTCIVLTHWMIGYWAQVPQHIVESEGSCSSEVFLFFFLQIFISETRQKHNELSNMDRHHMTPHTSDKEIFLWSALNCLQPNKYSYQYLNVQLYKNRLFDRSKCIVAVIIKSLIMCLCTLLSSCKHYWRMRELQDEDALMWW